MPLRHFLTAPSIIEELPSKAAQDEKDTRFRPPAVPLIAVDPYFSIWSCDNKLTDDWSRHWTGLSQGLGGLLRIDGKVHRFMGPEPHDAPEMRQVGSGGISHAHGLHLPDPRGRTAPGVPNAGVAGRP